jgi:hypothetical protein
LDTERRKQVEPTGYETQYQEDLEDVEVDGETYTIVGYWTEGKPDNEYDFYDVHDDAGFCINEGYPFYEKPTASDIKVLLD